MDDVLICVDTRDNPVGTLGKWECHQGVGVLHRAFSLFIQRQDGRILFQQRSAMKPLWPGFWANSCCSHPRIGEKLQDAVRRRAHEELGITIGEPTWLFSFEYRAEYAKLGVEHELCHVYVVQIPQVEAAPNVAEVTDVAWLSLEEGDKLIADSPNQVTPWLMLEWFQVRKHLGRV